MPEGLSEGPAGGGLSGEAQNQRNRPGGRSVGASEAGAAETRTLKAKWCGRAVRGGGELPPCRFAERSFSLPGAVLIPSPLS